MSSRIALSAEAYAIMNAARPPLPWPHRPSRRIVSRRAALRGLVLLSAGTALLAACGQRGPTLAPATPTIVAQPPVFEARPAPTPRPAVSTGAAGAPKAGGTLIVARSVETPSLDPQVTPSLARQRITVLTYNNLVKLSTDVAIQPDLAETWKVS